MRSVENDLKHIVSFSGGKDSTAMLLLLLEQNKPIDEVVFFDAGSWDFPEMRHHIDKVEKYTGVKITRLQAQKSFDYWMFEHLVENGKNKGRAGYGFPSVKLRWCTREKIRTINNYISNNYKTISTYIGYAFDEQWRANKNKDKSNIYPLIESEISENQTLAMCYNYGFTWDGLYEHFRRVSCWCCPLQRISELRKLYNLYPDLWKKLEDMQKRTNSYFRMDGKRVEELTKRFEAEKLQISLFPNGFEKAEVGWQKIKKYCT
jgi:3'-phosphoadenosine 5'-phosphosulfate sulfotransferase (PAPS reductase)/FAD synthetase